jgi:hypothetical protein
MRSSRHTTGQVAENSVAGDATDGCHLRRIFATDPIIHEVVGPAQRYVVHVQSDVHQGEGRTQLAVEEEHMEEDEVPMGGSCQGLEFEGARRMGRGGRG